jgi:hypothetical protein
MEGAKMKRSFIAAVALFVVMTTSYFSPEARSIRANATKPQMTGGPTSVVATRITNRSAPFIDGSLDDIWQNAGRIAFPAQSSDCFTLSSQSYNQLDPSTFTVYFLHDDINLYIAIQTLDDRMVEGSDYDQNSDGLAGMTIEAKGGSQRMYRLMWHREKIAPCDSSFTGPPLDGDRMVFDVEWRSALRGSWNNNSDRDAGYTFEFSIPLKDPVADPDDGPKGLGGWQAGDQMRANIVLVDHDGKPGATFDDPAAAFRKCYWGSDKPEDLSVPRSIILSNAPALGESGSDKNITAKRIDSASAPVINGSVDESIWQQAGKLRFPSSVGRTFTNSKARYNAGDPSSYTAYFLHDDSYLYVGVKAEDRMIESSACPKSGGCEDQASDGLISLAFEMKGGGGDRRYSTFWFLQDETVIVHDKKDCQGTPIQNAVLRLRQGPPRYPYDTERVSWAPTINGTWNNNSDIDTGYDFEYKIPLGGINGLGGYAAGDFIPANLVIVDHDSKPEGSITECSTNFKKFWWGFDGNEFYPPDNSGQRRFVQPDEARSIFLDDGFSSGPQGTEKDAATKAIDYIASQQVPFSGLIRSFPDEIAAHTYDNAVALIALTDADRREEAKRLADALISVLEAQDSQAFFYDSYNVVDKIVSQGTASGTGPNAWAAFALAFYGGTYADQKALDAANKVARWVTGKLQKDDGGVLGGVCHPFDEQTRDHGSDMFFAFNSTEQVLDSWHLLRILGYRAQADKVKSWLTSAGKGWIDTDDRSGNPCKQDGRFSTGTNDDCGQDKRLYLDPQSWGAIFALLAGEPEKARGAINAAEELLKVDSQVNGQLVSGFGDSCLPKDQAIWYGGTAQMIVAYIYNNDLTSAMRYLAEMKKVQNKDGSWNHSSDESLTEQGEKPCNHYESFHAARPHIGETAWNYFALQDVIKGKKLPYIISLLRITAISIEGKSLLVFGNNFEQNAVILVNGKKQKTTNDAQNPTSLLIASQAGKKIKPGRPVRLQVRNPDGRLSLELLFQPL